MDKKNDVSVDKKANKVSQNNKKSDSMPQKNIKVVSVPQSNKKTDSVLQSNKKEIGAKISGNAVASKSTISNAKGSTLKEKKLTGAVSNKVLKTKIEHTNAQAKNYIVHTFDKSKKDLKKKMTKQMVRSIILMALLVVFLIFFLNPNIIPFISDEQKAVVQSFVDKNFASISITANGTELLNIAISFVIMLAIVLITYSLVRVIIASIHCKSSKQVTIQAMILNVLKYTTALVIIIWGLGIFGINMIAIFTGVGIVGMIIGFGAQSLIEDMFTGVFIVFEGQFSVGDIVMVDNFRGKVQTIGVRTTTIVDACGNVKIVNNSDIRNVNNLSSQISIAMTDISIAYSASIEKAEKVIEKTCEKLPELYPEIFKTNGTYLGVQSLSASSVDLRVSAEVLEADIFKATRLLNRELKLAMDKAKIEIPFPQVVVYNRKEKE